MKIAVIGGGTAGFLACAHLTKNFPQWDLYHIYDPNIPSIGVGEGTTPDFVAWLNKYVGECTDSLLNSCYATRKYGIQFEGWGEVHTTFNHNFYPISEQFAYHISAGDLAKFLESHINAENIAKHVSHLENQDKNCDIIFSDETTLLADFVFDARGFPKELDDKQHLNLPFIPTNAAIIHAGEQTLHNQMTRSVARPHGWIFIIPLQNRTSYGYIFNSDINSDADIEADFALFFEEENLAHLGQKNGRRINFPSFFDKNCLEKNVMKIGNSASFLEPLEATAIHFILTQLKTISYWPLGKWAEAKEKTEMLQQNIDVVNRFLAKHLIQIAFFVGWHYQEGSRYDTPFWQYARENFQSHAKQSPNLSMIEDFESFVKRAYQVCNPHTQPEEFDKIIRETFQAIAELEERSIDTKVEKNGKGETKVSFGLFSEWSFAEMGRGIGYEPNSILRVS